MPAPVYLNELGLVCALGTGKDEVTGALFSTTAPQLSIRRDLRERPTQVGAVTSRLVAPHEPTRNRITTLVLTAMEELRTPVDAVARRHGPERVAVVLGTSIAGVAENTPALDALWTSGRLPPDFDLGVHELGAPAHALSQALGLRGPAYAISNACTSSSKALVSAARLLRAHAADAVIAGGVDILTRLTVMGFESLDALSESRCNPLSSNRQGINLGEGAAFFLMTREPGPVRLSGWGESSDAHHISAPEPEGRGALTAMRLALERAGLQPSDVDYVNLHGTGTLQNDAMESRAVQALLGTQVRCSSTKPLTGHTLAAAGALEAAFCWLSMMDTPRARLPPHWWDGQQDPALPALRLVKAGDSLPHPLRHALSNSFAFGGSNTSLVLSRT